MTLKRSATLIKKASSIIEEGFQIQSLTDKRTKEDKITSIEINLSRDKHNDTAIITCVRDFNVAEIFKPAKIQHGTIVFSGVCSKVEKSGNLAQYTIVSPSILLSRNESSIFFNKATAIKDILSELIPSEFTVHAESIMNKTYKNENMIGRYIINILEDIADYFKLKLFISGWDIYIDSEFPQDVGRNITLTNEEVKKNSTEVYGGSDIYTSVLGRALIDNEGFGGKTILETYEEDVFDSPVKLTDVLTVEDLAYVKTYEGVVSAVHARVMEIREEALTYEFELRGIKDIRPLDVVSIGSKDYAVTSVKHDIKVLGKTVITVCEA